MLEKIEISFYFYLVDYSFSAYKWFEGEHKERENDG